MISKWLNEDSSSIKNNCCHKYYSLKISEENEEEFCNQLAEVFGDAFVLYKSSDKVACWKDVAARWDGFSETQKCHYRSFFQEGFTNLDGQLNPTTEIGTHGEMIMNLYIQDYFSPLLQLPKKAKCSSGIDSDFVSIIGDENDYNSLVFKIWECKASDEDNLNSSKIYNQLGRRLSRVSGSVAKMLIEEYKQEYNLEENTALGKFIYDLPNIIRENRQSLHRNVFLVVGKLPTGEVLRDFDKKFEHFSNPMNRNIVMIHISDHRDLRNKLWKLLKIIE